MNRPSILLPGALAVFAACGAETVASAASPGTPLELQQACEGRDGYTDSAPPMKIHGNTWFVGTCGITAVLVTSTQGHILIDGGPADAADLVLASIERLGFRPRDVRWIVSSHTHDDHVGALAALQRRTGARIAALDKGVLALSSGKPDADDPQRAIASDFPAVRISRVLRDGEHLGPASLRLTVHSTPVHTPGSASWTWTSCEVDDCRSVAYVDSATVISAPGYRFTGHPARLAGAREGLHRMARLECAILVTPHPGASDLFDRLSGKEPLIDPQACIRYAHAAQARLDARLDDEAKVRK